MRPVGEWRYVSDRNIYQITDGEMQDDIRIGQAATIKSAEKLCCAHNKAIKAEPAKPRDNNKTEGDIKIARDWWHVSGRNIYEITDGGMQGDILIAQAATIDGAIGICRAHNKVINNNKQKKVK